jgi:Hint domain
VADINSFNIETGTVFIRALPTEDLSGWQITSYNQKGNGSEPTSGQLVDTSMPYTTDPPDGYIYYRQELGPLSSSSGQRDALVLEDDNGSVVDAVGWGKDTDFDLDGGSGDGTTISPEDGTYAPGDGPWYSYGPPWETTTSPVGPDGLVPISPPCFAAGTLIDTPSGPTRIERLRKGQLITTFEGSRRIIWVGGTKVRLDCDDVAYLRPVRFSIGSLGSGKPTSEVLLSQQHRVYLSSAQNELLFGVAGVFAPAKFLINDNDIVLDTTLSEISYFHILLEEHHVVCANGMHAESLMLGEWAASKSSFQALAEFRDIFSGTAVEEIELSYRPSHTILKKYEAALLCKN